MAWAICLGGVVVSSVGCQLPLADEQHAVGVPSSALLGTRYARASISRLKTGNPVLDEIDDFVTALSVDVNLPVSETIDLQGFLGNREASGELVDPVVGPYEMTVTAQYIGAGLTAHASPGEVLDPYIFVAGQYLARDVTQHNSLGSISIDEDEFGWVAGGGIEWRPHGSVAVSPYIKYFDNAVFGEGTRVGGRIDTWLNRNWFLEVLGEAPISADGHAIGLGLGFRY